MRSQRLSLLRVWRASAVPLALALPPLFWVADATRRAAHTTLGRDQGIFQTIAWALAHGAVDYRDVRDVNGPLTHIVHLVFRLLGGADERRFRVLDLTLTGASFAIAGACVPSVGRRRAGVLERALWAAAAWVVLSGQYLLYGFWDSAQRESFFAWLMLPSVALQLVAQRPRAAAARAVTDSAAGRRGERRAALLFAAVGAASVVPWFGKPTYAFFSAAQIVALLADPAWATRRKKALLAFAAGGAAGAATQIAFVLARGDLSAWLRIQLVDVPTMYRFIWARSAADILATPFYAEQALFAVAGLVVFVALVVAGAMPPRSLGVALVPACALGSVVVQAKGFPYHFHPVTAGVALQWLVFVAWLSDRTRVARRREAMRRLAPIALAVAVALHVGGAMADSPYVRDPWLLTSAASPDAPGYYAHFVRSDFFPDEMRSAAAFLREHTRPDESVQTYGMDPYVLFLADRASATPYIYAYDLDADAALAGGAVAPDDDQAARIRRLRDDHEADLLRRVEARPPAAFVFVDGSPLLSESDAWLDFVSHCTSAAAWVEARYDDAADFGHHHVWLRRPLPPSSASAPRGVDTQPLPERHP